MAFGDFVFSILGPKTVLTEVSSGPTSTDCTREFLLFPKLCTQMQHICISVLVKKNVYTDDASCIYLYMATSQTAFVLKSIFDFEAVFEVDLV